MSHLVTPRTASAIDVRGLRAPARYTGATMLLALDIGNTNVTIGVFDGERIAATWRLATDVHRQPDEYALQLKNLLPMKGVAIDAIDGVVLCSVVPPLTVVFEDACSFLFDIQPLVVGTGTRTGVRVRYDNPRDVGADRVADAAAAYHLYGGPCIIVDFGTATVFDAISADGEYLGGAIAPGLRVSAESLYAATSQLRRVELTAPPAAIGKNTAHSIQSGLIFGYTGMIEHMVNLYRQEMNAPNATVVATGGLATTIAEQTGIFTHINLDLTLQGLRLIFDLNAEQRLTTEPPRSAT
jgi:type III pantothenate kinase